jgi:DNA-binding transcriptional regulator LsrR (DeoR family)
MKQRKRSRGSQSPVNEELLAMVMFYFGEGKKATEIAELLNVRREVPYKLLRVAAERHRLQYLAAPELKAMFRIRSKYTWLDDVRVANSAVTNDVSYHTAQLVLDLIKRYHEGGRSEIHIAFAGGALLRETARILANSLRDAVNLRDLRIVFHALVAGFNETDPTADPNSFLGHFAMDAMNAVSFVNLLAPGIVTSGEAATLRSIRAIKEAYARAGEIDIVVTSAGSHWGESGCSRLFRLYQSLGGEDCVRELLSQGAIGDIAWRPISETGPIISEVAVRAMTLLELADFADLVRRKKHVVLALAPCGTCGKPKLEVLKALLAWRPFYINNLILDSVTARSL